MHLLFQHDIHIQQTRQMKAIFDLLQHPDTLIAVVGATDNPSKFGNIIYRDLKRKGYRVVPVNPTRTTVDGDPCYASLKSIPRQTNMLINIVVPPGSALQVLHECLELGWINVWLQPGTESDEVMAYLEQHHFNYLAQACIMVESRR